MDGGAIAMYNMAQGFHDHQVDLTLLSYNTTKHYLEEVPSALTDLGKIITVDIDNRVKPLDALLNLFSQKSYHVQRFESIEFAKKLQHLLENEQYDIVHFEGLFTSMYIDIVRQYAPNTKCVLRQHNIEHLIWERVSQQEKFPKNQYVRLLAKRLKKFELEKIHQFDAIIPITEVDAHFFKKQGVKNYFVSPTGIDPKKFTSDILSDEQSVFHLGSMDWIPNQEGVKWFVEEIWPNVIETIPEATFKIAGRHLPDWMKEWNQYTGIEVLGEIPDAVEFLHQNQIMVVPLHAGSGLRIKIIEGLAAGKAIVSTSIGAEGVEYKNGENIVIADSSGSFSEAIIELIQKKSKLIQISTAAKQLAFDKYSNFAITEALLNYYKQL